METDIEGEYFLPIGFFFEGNSYNSKVANKSFIVETSSRTFICLFDCVRLYVPFNIFQSFWDGILGLTNVD